MSSATGTPDIFAWTKKWALDQGIKLWAEPETHSTNTVAKEDQSLVTIPSGGDPTLYITRRQTQGRGRGTNIWITPDQGALLSSWSFAEKRMPQPIFSPLAGLALFEACASTWPGVSFNLKAPNDLYIGDRKTAGLLIEIVDRGHERQIVVGLGLNVSASPPDVSTSTCLAQHLQTEVSEILWNSFLNSWLVGLKNALREGTRDLMTPSACSRLKAALNLHPLLSEPFLEVDELGQLHSASRVIRWQEL
jgi:BirA family transcriptional regulator, biotin operon repressor / biotin---[acetyl-CoA-carboxylase] ligase